MNDAHDPVELDAEALAMLAIYRDEERPGTDLKNRVWTRLEAAPAAAVVDSGGRSPAKWVALGAALAAGLVLAIAGIRGAVVLTEDPANTPHRSEATLQHEAVESGGDAQHKRPVPAPRPTVHRTAPSTEAPAVPEPVPPPEVEPEAAPSPRRRAKAPAGRTPAPATAETLAEETRLLKRARTALAAGNANGTLTLLRSHARKFPKGVLAEERDALKAVALCSDGRAQGRRAAKAFARRYPRSTLLGRVSSACEAAKKDRATP